jgi:CheY-like chemotaxis protein
VESMRPYATEQQVQLRLEIANDAAGAIVKGDRSRLNQTFCNVLHNAIKFSPAGSYVRVECEVSDSEAITRIADQGEGIPAQFLPHVFERFRQADGSRTRAYGGLGLGLALVKNFVAVHGGTIEASSGGEGKGSVFVIKLPRETAGQEEKNKKETELDREDKKDRVRIMIVEDQADTLEMLAAHFSARDYEVFACTSAAEALELASRQQFDLLISDIAMPAMDGLELIRNLRQKEGLEETPAIALTGYASVKDSERAIAAGFNMHLAKPIDPAELAQAVNNLLASCQNREPERRD